MLAHLNLIKHGQVITNLPKDPQSSDWSQTKSQFFEFTANRMITLNYTQKTFDREFQELSIGM
jgi:hypothetical protein